MNFPTEETIKFELYLKADYPKNPPRIQILLDDHEKFNGVIEKGEKIVSFHHTCSFLSPHRLTLVRYGKTNNDTIKDPMDPEHSYVTQMLILKKLKIDGIDIRDIVWVKSITEPQYPEPWASNQKAMGNVLEEKIIGCTEFGHNCKWYLDFTSPFYYFIMKWMNGNLT